MNKNIQEAKNKFKILLISLVIFQIFFLFLINIFFNKISLETGSGDADFQLIKNIIKIVLTIIFIIVDIIFYIKFIYRLHTMINVEPKRCIIEDFIMYPYGYSSGTGSRRRIDYRIAPVIRDLESNKLYFTYRDYDLSYFNSKYIMMNDKLVSNIIFRKDKSEVKIGDTAYCYVKKEVNVDVKIEEDNNIIILNNKKMHYLHTNEKYNINIFNEIIFFEGIVEVEDINVR